MVTLRPPTLADAQAVFDMLVARDLVDYGIPDITLADLHDEWRAANCIAVLAETERGAIVGYAIMHRPGAMGFVSPDHEGQGIGTQLVDWAQRRERDLGRAHHGQAAPASNARARELFDAFGYAYERSYSRMVRALDGAKFGPPPANATLRALVPDQDASAVHALNELSFAANSDYTPEPLDEFVGEHLRAHDHAPELSLVAHDGDTMVGFLLARRWPQQGVGFVDLLAVHPQARRRGLGSTLLQTAVARFAATGLREAQLGVASDNPRALQIYERAGMTPRFVVDAYRRPIASAPLDSQPMSTGHQDFNAQIIDEFRANEGRVGGMFAGATLLVLHHTGAQSGTRRVTPLVYKRDGERYVIFASRAGAPTNPAWYHNLKAHPDTEIEIGTKSVAVRASEATGEERERLFEAQAQSSPQFGEYQRKTDRVIPVIVLTPR